MIFVTNDPNIPFNHTAGYVRLSSIQKILKGPKFFFHEEVKEAVGAWLAEQDKIFFLKALEALPVQLKKTIQLIGEYACWEIKYYFQILFAGVSC